MAWKWVEKWSKNVENFPVKSKKKFKNASKNSSQATIPSKSGK